MCLLIVSITKTRMRRTSACYRDPIQMRGTDNNLSNIGDPSLVCTPTSMISQECGFSFVNPDVSIDISCRPLGLTGNLFLILSVRYDLWLPQSSITLTLVLSVGSAGLRQLPRLFVIRQNGCFQSKER